MSSLTKEEQLSKQLIEKGMTVHSFEYYPTFKNMVLHEGFKVIYEKDARLGILPTLQRFEKQAQMFFSLPLWLSRLIVKVFPSEFTHNAISGYLIPLLIRKEIATYEILVAKK